MNRKSNFILLAVISGFVGFLYTFGGYTLIKKTLHIGFGLRNNDHVLIGTITLTIALASLYAALKKK